MENDGIWRSKVLVHKFREFLEYGAVAVKDLNTGQPTAQIFKEVAPYLSELVVCPNHPPVYLVLEAV